MANYSLLKQAIQNVVRTNGNNEITGALLQQSLLAMINSLGAGYMFIGVATTDTNPGTPDQNVWYLASIPGTYANFSGLAVNDGELCALCWNGTWTKKVSGAATTLQVAELGQKIDNLALGKFYGFFPATADLPAGDEPGYAYVGASSPFTIYVFKDGAWSDSGSVYGPADGNGEDIDTNENGKLQFANRPTTYGMGYKILRRDKTFAEQVGDSNTVYEIRYNFDLGGASVTIPAGCVLKFVGGSVSNGTITGNDTEINAGQSEIFSALTISGTWNIEHIYSCWFQRDKYVIENVMELNNPDIFSEIYIDGDYDVYVRKTGINGIDIVSNTTVHISGTLTKDASSVTSTSSLFTISGENISIIGGCIDGNKTAFSSTNEYGFGFYIENSFGVQIDSVSIRNCHGDGIYIGGTELNKNFNVRNCEIYGCRRNGISIIYAQNILIDETFIHDISGTAPGAAIDVEPNFNYQLCKNLVMRNCIIENCIIGISLAGTNAAIENSFFENVLVEFENYTHLILLNRAIRTNFVNCTFNTTGARNTTYAVTGTGYSYACFENCAFVETGTAPATSYYNAVAGRFIKCEFDIISSFFMDTFGGNYIECIFNCASGFCNYSTTNVLGALVQRCQITAKGGSSINLQGRTAAAPTRNIKIIDCVLNLTPTYYPLKVQYAEDIEISGCKMQVSGSRNLLSVFFSQNVRINGNTIIVGSDNSVIAFSSSPYGQANDNIISAADGVTLTATMFVGINNKTNLNNAPGVPFYYETEHKMLMNNGTSIVNLDGSPLT